MKGKLGKIKTIIGVSTFIFVLGLAGTSDLESQCNYVTRAVATESNILVTREGDELKVSQPLEKGKEYKVTLDAYNNETIKKIKVVK
ncbi:MAG: hypothetical protein RR128_08730 [Clostridium sp.]